MQTGAKSMALAYALKKKSKTDGMSAMPDSEEDQDYEDGELVDRVMAKRMSKGGMVANETGMSADFSPNNFDDLVLRDELESSYTGENSGDELGNEQEDADRRDIVTMIMKSRAKKDRMPRPA